MASYHFESTEGVGFGTYEADTEIEALAALHREAGYDVTAEDGELVFGDDETARLCSGLEGWRVRPTEDVLADWIDEFNTSAREYNDPAGPVAESAKAEGGDTIRVYDDNTEWFGTLAPSGKVLFSECGDLSGEHTPDEHLFAYYTD